MGSNYRKEAINQSTKLLQKNCAKRLRATKFAIVIYTIKTYLWEYKTDSSTVIKHTYIQSAKIILMHPKGDSNIRLFAIASRILIAISVLQ